MHQHEDGNTGDDEGECERPPAEVGTAPGVGDEAEVLAELLVAPIRLAANRLGREGRGLKPRVGGIIAERLEFLDRPRNPIFVEHPDSPAGILLAKLGGHTHRQKMVGQGPGRVFLAQGTNLAQSNVPQTVAVGRAERSPGPRFHSRTPRVTGLSNVPEHTGIAYPSWRR